MNKKTLRDLDVKGKRVFCRVDFNVPMEKGVITDDTRIQAGLPTIEYLQAQGARIIIATHLGRPKGEVVEELRLDEVAKHLSNLLGKELLKTDAVYGSEVDEAIAQLEDGDILLLENVRFERGEEQNDETLARRFADMADLYVNDAFGVAHRAHASTAGVAELLPAAAGFLMEREIDVLGNALANPARPFTAIIGGAKVKDKITVIDQMLDKVDNILIGGGLAFTFVKAQGHEIGKSLLEEDKIELAQQFMEKAKEKGVQFLIPVDAIVASSFSETADSRIVSVEDIPADWMALDIGPETRAMYRSVIEASKVTLWNGPMGVFEMAPFAGGTEEVARALAEADGYSIIGGGDSAAAVEKFHYADAMDHISTGGGASLEFMEGKSLPAIEALDDK